jgi:RsiW-degrading membrane proteinase PrsW (M82 family)
MSQQPSRQSSGQSWQQQMAYQPQASVPGNATVRPRLRRALQTGVLVTVFALCALLLTATITGATGLTGALLGILAASTAIGIVVPVFLWVDRLEAEPARLLWFAFLWGALVSTVGALLLNQFGMAFFAGLQVDPMLAGAVVVAPAVEEFLKCLGVLLIFLMARREFNGVVDGIVYAGVAAAGFAFVENIIYLGMSYSELGTPGLLGVFVVRCLMSPFAHPMFTVCFGLALGLIAHRRSWPYALVPLGGYLLAVFLHALWNFAAVATGEGFFLVYAVVQVPLFVGFVTILVWARRRESRMLREYLTAYGINGWFSPAEVAMLVSPGERRRARAWAKGVGGRQAAQSMRAFQDEATELAVTRKHLNRGDRDPAWPVRERSLLDSVQQHRMAFAAPVSPGTARHPGGPASPGGVGVRQQ